MRGEYSLYATPSSPAKELPPRARRIHQCSATEAGRLGTTSACAENTHRRLHGLVKIGNYLRVRGEYPNLQGYVECSKELPPRARRIRVYADPETGLTGTTSACAENTSTCGMTFFPTRNYLRVRGEYRNIAVGAMIISELPPRARRILAGEAQKRTNQGTTSACAENTCYWGAIGNPEGNYLRVRGEYR